MPDYMILIREDEGAQQRMAPAQTRALLQAHADYVQRLQAAGAYRDGERLRPSAEGKRVHADKVDAGPFGDERAIAGYYVVKADDLDAAVALAAPCPVSPGDSLDVRPVMSGVVRGDKGTRKGKTFAFGVLGHADSEAAWVGVMDRIDAETRDGSFDERFAGGVRLEAPGRGRVVVGGGAKPMVMDGPFLESKEVIGGIFFMRMPDLDAAVAWARGSRFMKYGALEVRELWRS